ncbi:unnamed protein product [Ceratitis capitata]|uniref:(Mediterranean fruit fly) hypothetical protein n=1 Tax=Ceratitis capitata TaxID=7213 RepID=A0A811U193_CERCA|nr:unnamed protein product [Ceratitis capitata]
MANIRALALFSCVLAMLLFIPAEPSALGAETNLTGQGLTRATLQLELALSKLSAGSGPSYKVVKVHTASQQVVTGTLTKYNVDLRDSNNAVNNCNVEIWSRPWLSNGNQVTIACAGGSSVVRSF